MTPSWTKATDLLNGAVSVLIVTHIRPDGDAIGSLLGLGNALMRMGKQVTMAVDEGVPSFLSFLPNASLVVNSLDSGTWDLLITTDCADESRTGAVGAFGFAHSKHVINIDHHPTNPLFGDVALVFDTAVSASEVVFDWWEHLAFSYEQEVALPLLTGMVTDSQGFRTSSTNVRTLEIATYLMRRGASLTEVTARALSSRSLQELELWKVVLPSVVVQDGLAYVHVRLADVRRVGFNETTDADLVQFLIGIDDVMIAVVFKERDGAVSVSMRAKRGYNVSETAVAFGGGGHVQASGATIAGTPDEVEARLLPSLREALSKGTLVIV